MLESVLAQSVPWRQQQQQQQAESEAIVDINTTAAATAAAMAVVYAHHNLGPAQMAAVPAVQHVQVLQ